MYTTLNWSYLWWYFIILWENCRSGKNYTETTLYKNSSPTQHSYWSLKLCLHNTQHPWCTHAPNNFMQSFISRTNFGGARTIGYFWITRKLPQKWRKRGSIIKWEIWDKILVCGSLNYLFIFCLFFFSQKLSRICKGT